MAVVGRTDGIDATAGDYPYNTTIKNNVVRDKYCEHN
jgi:hypothetical protein